MPPNTIKARIRPIFYTLVRSFGDIALLGAIGGVVAFAAVGETVLLATIGEAVLFATVGGAVLLGLFIIKLLSKYVIPISIKYPNR